VTEGPRPSSSPRRHRSTGLARSRICCAPTPHVKRCCSTTSAWPEDHPGSPPGTAFRRQTPEARAAISALAELHHSALHQPCPNMTAVTYARVWHNAWLLSESIDPRRNAAGSAQVLMFLHDSAQVLGRADIALGCARKAVRILQSVGTGTASTDDQVRLHSNARFAEVVSLNTLGLRNEARAATASAEPLRGYHREPGTWLRVLPCGAVELDNGLPARFDLRRGEHRRYGTRPRARRCHSPGRRYPPAHGHLPDLTARSRRRADLLADRLRPIATLGAAISPLRRAQLLRTLARYSRSVNDTAGTAAMVTECLRVTAEANLIYQRGELVREFGTAAR
jgi:hypothetical protein